jgi:hypothetical protein
LARCGRDIAGLREVSQLAQNPRPAPNPGLMLFTLVFSAALENNHSLVNFSLFTQKDKLPE